MNITEQIKTVNPSVAPALFRLLMRDEGVSYLREENKNIIGFEITPNSELMSGFLLIGMRKQTVYAYRSEDATPRLIIFPSMDKLFNRNYNILGLSAKKIKISDDSFNGEELGVGLIGDLVKDLTPPEKNVDLPEHLTDQMVRIMMADYIDQEENDGKPAYATIERFTRQGETQTPFQADGIPTVSTDLTDEVQTLTQDPNSQEPTKTPGEIIKDTEFKSEQDIITFVVMNFGIDRRVLVTLLNALLSKTQGFTSEKRREEYKELIIRLVNEKPEIITKQMSDNKGGNDGGGDANA